MKASWRIAWVGVVILAAVAAFPVRLAWGQETQVIVTGKAPGKGEDAREEAVRHAMRRAVERVAVKVYGESRTENYVTILDRVLTRSQGYVKGYKILKETVEDGNTVLKVRVNVSIRLVKDDWGVIQTALETAGKPRLLVFIEDVVDKKHSLRAVTENALTEYLSKKDFPLVDGEQVRAVEKRELKAARAAGDHGRIARLGTQYKSEIALFGEAEAGYGGTVTVAGVTVHQYSAQLDIRVIRTDTAQILGQINATGKASTMNRSRAAKDALRDAAKKAGKKFVKTILKKWRDESYGGAAVILVINDVGFSDLDRVIAELKKRKGVVSVTQRHYRGGSAELEVTSKLTPRRLAQTMEALEGCHITVEEFTARRIVTKFRGKRKATVKIETRVIKKTETVRPVPPASKPALE